MTRVYKLIVGLGACIALVISAALVADAISKLGPFTDDDLPNRWVIQQDLPDGLVMFDTATGRLCVVPTGQNNLQPIRCTKSPESY